MDELLNNAQLSSSIVLNIKEEKRKNIQTCQEEIRLHHHNLLHYENETKYYVQLSQKQVQNEMNQIQKNLKEEDEEKKKNILASQQKQLERKNQNIQLMQERKKRGGGGGGGGKGGGGGLPTAQELETAFHAVKPFVTQKTDVSGHNLPVTMQQLTRVVISRVQRAEKEKFELLTRIQQVERKINIQVTETMNIEKTMKSIIQQSAANTSKSHTQVSAMKNVLQRLRHAAHRAEQERIRIEQR